MKKMIALLALLLAPVLASAYTPRVDGSWFDSGCFGCPGDTVKGEVLEQQADMDAAEAALEADRSRENLEEALSVALFSHVKAAHALELGDLAQASGDTAKAIKWYEECLVYAKAAVDMPSNSKFIGRKGQNVPQESHTEGKKWKGYADRRLAKLQPAK